jgi:hypothetical protein
MLQGGLIHKIPKSKLGESRTLESIPKLANNLVEYLCFKDNVFISVNKFNIYGSFSYRLQSFPGDIDSTNIVEYATSEDIACKDIVKQLQNLTKKLLSNHLNRHYSDLKCGTYPNGESIHWKAHEVIQGFRDPNVDDINGFKSKKKITLYDAVSDKGAMIKLDMLAEYMGRYVEVSCLYQVSTENGPLTLLIEDETNKFLSSLAKDTGKQLKKGKFFKVIKRMFSNAKLRGDEKILKILEPLIDSNLSRLASLKADLSTLKLLLSVGKFPDNDVLKNELDKFKFSLDNILDIKLPFDDIYKKIDKLYTSIKDKKKTASNKLLDVLESTLDDVINTETIKYLNSVKIKDFNFFGKKYIS